MTNQGIGGGLGGESLTPRVPDDGASRTPPTPDDWKLPDLRIDQDGEWYDEGVQVTHPGILANLRSNLRRDSEGYFIQTRVRIPVRVDDVPFVVIRLERHGDDLDVRLNDDTGERIDPATLRVGAGDVPYCRVKNGAFEARFSRAAAWQLLQLADYDEAKGIGLLRLGGTSWTLRRVS